MPTDDLSLSVPSPACEKPNTAYFAPPFGIPHPAPYHHERHWKSSRQASSLNMHTRLCFWEVTLMGCVRTPFQVTSKIGMSKSKMMSCSLKYILSYVVKIRCRIQGCRIWRLRPTLFQSWNRSRTSNQGNQDVLWCRDLCVVHRADNPLSI